MVGLFQGKSQSEMDDELGGSPILGNLHINGQYYDGFSLEKPEPMIDICRCLIVNC